METQSSSEILHDFSPRFLINKDGRVERLRKDIILPPSHDPETLVYSKDVTISPTASARVYRPNDILENTKLPIVIYIHGGAYCQYSAFSMMYHTYLNSLVSQANIITVSVDYRLAPEYPVPACYDDAWDVTRWVLSHTSESGPDPWIVQWADMGRVFLAGDSVGATMSHNMLSRAGPSGLIGCRGVKIEGAVLVHPFFSEGELDPLVEFLSEGKMGKEDPKLSPTSDPAGMRRDVVCDRMLLCVDKDDALRSRGVKYYETLKESGWEGVVELLETNGGGHVFHLWDPKLEKAHEFLKLIAFFVNGSR